MTVHLTSFRLQRASALACRLQATPGQPLEASEKTIVSDRPADALRAAQPLDDIVVRFGGEQIGEVGEVVPCGIAVTVHLTNSFRLQRALALACPGSGYARSAARGETARRQISSGFRKSCQAPESKIFRWPFR